MIKEAIEKLLDIAKPDLHTVTDVFGVETNYSTKPIHQVKAAPPPESELVHVNTLTGFRALVHAKLDGQNFQESFLVHVEGEGIVTLKARTSDEYGRRLDLIKATPVEFKKFPFGQWVSQEEFAIMVASLFADTPDKDYVLKMASTLTNEAASTTEDDGFTQRVNVKAGMKMKESITIKSRVDLAPYRTFPELPQPVSSFVLRAKNQAGDQPALMLVEADGGRWKIDAIAAIRQAMEAFDLNIPIIA